MRKVQFVSIRSWVRLLRPTHWIKNLIVFIPLFFAGGLPEAAVFTNVLLSFFSFCLVASAVYVLNDLMDVENDRKHPTKRARPIAAGEISERVAAVTCIVLALVSLVLAFACAGLPGLGLVGLYALVNVGYSLGLKRVPIVDVVLLSAGYVIRMVFGALASGVAISGWLYLTVMVGSFFLGLGKRRGEIDAVGTGSRAVLRGYTRDFLDKNMYVCLTLTMTFYALWARERPLRLATVPLVLLIFMRYSLDIEREGDGDPMNVVLHDPMLIGLVVLYALSAVFVVYFPGVYS